VISELSKNKSLGILATVDLHEGVGMDLVENTANETKSNGKDEVLVEIALEL
jgi:hypothetical protein